MSKNKQRVNYVATIQKNTARAIFLDKNLKKCIETSEPIDYRLSLTFRSKYPKNNKNILVLMMNPSDASENQSDKTTNMVISSLNNQSIHFKKITTVNVLPKIESSSGKIKSFSNLYSQICVNKNEIKRLFNQNNISDIIIATGSMNIDDYTVHNQFMESYKEIIQYLNTISRNYNIYKFGSLNSKGYTRHPVSLNLGEKLTPATIDFNNVAFIK